MCNATLYLSQYVADRNGLKTLSTFIHLPLDLSQVVHADQDASAWPRETLAAAVGLILQELATEEV